MCGIYGEFRFEGTVDPAAARARLDRLAHRGPDGQGLALGDFRAGTVALAFNQAPPDAPGANWLLGHRRLSIIDLSDAALQPMATPESDYLIVFNGEIYNFAEIKPELLRRGHVFRTDHSDTEVLLHAFAEWGETCLGRLRGMFALAVFCRRERKVFLARDRLGQKPLYYRLDASGFAFASELLPLAAGARPAIDETGLARYLLLGYVPDPGTILAGFHKLPPAHCAWLDLERRSLDVRPYWDVPAGEDERPSGREWEARVRDTLARAVRYRLITDVPLGLFLSGGIDSTLIAKMASEQSPDPLTAYSADFLQRGFSERRWGDQAAARYGLNVRYHLIDLAVAQRYQETIDVLDEPFDGGSAIASYELFRGARGHVKVVLTGDGGDELFAGYDRYRTFRRRAAPVAGLRRLPLGPRLLELGSRAGRLAPLRDLLRGHYLLDYFGVRNRPGLLRLLRRPPADWRDLLGFAAPLLAAHDGPQVRAARYLELKTILPGRMLFKLDRFSMAFGIEGRSPFMDHELVELAFRIPARHLLDRRQGKKVLKSIVRQDLGRAFVERRKVGFGNPLHAWFESPARGQLLEGLRSPDAPIYRYLDPDLVAARKEPGTLWRLVVLARYLERLEQLSLRVDPVRT